MLSAGAAVELRMCPECGEGFEPKSHNQVFCCRGHAAKWRYGHPEIGFPRTAECVQCGKEFRQVADYHKFCDGRCRDKARHRRKYSDPLYRQKNKSRCQKWYVEHKAQHQVRVLAYRKNNRAKVSNDNVSPLVSIISQAPEGPDPWSLPAPELDYLPGGAFTLDMRPRFKFGHDQISALHGMVTAITGAHMWSIPVFSLLPWNSGCGWAAYVSKPGIAPEVAGKAHGISFDGQPAVMHCGPLVRIRAPRVEPGEHILTVEAITPVVVRAYGRTVSRVVPCSRHLRGTLEGFLPRRIGVEMPLGTVALEMLEDNTRSETLKLRGNGRKLGDSTGWVGSVKVRVNAPGRWLLECAALGLGYGGRVGFGFGRIRVKCET